MESTDPTLIYGEHSPYEAASRLRSPRKSLSETRRLQGTRGVIVTTARRLFERHGVRGTTMAAIAQEATVTRELIYYHFGNKNGVIEAVIDDYVEDLVESIIVWNESRIFGDTEGSLRKCIHSFRYALYDAEGRPRPMIGVLEELGVRNAFDVRATKEAVDCICGPIVEEYAAYHQIEISLVYEMFCLVIFGMVGLLKVRPNISDEDLMKVVEQTLRLDMKPLKMPG